MNKYPAWKYVIIVVALVAALLYTLPNLFGESPAIQVSGLRTVKADASTQTLVEEALKTANVAHTGIVLDGENLKLSFAKTDDQIKARDVIAAKLGTTYIVALNALSNSPKWLAAFGAKPMNLGLDLRGGVHFLMEVDMKFAIDRAIDRYRDEARGLLREKKIYYSGLGREGERIVIRFKEKPAFTSAKKELENSYSELLIRDSQAGEESVLTLTMKPETVIKLRDSAIEQNISALRKRVNELGVSEPIIQKQGADRIVVQLAGVQDPTRAKDVIGRTATLEMRLVAEEAADSQDQMAFERYRNEPAPFGTEKMLDGSGRVVLVKKSLVLTGDKVTDAQPGFEQQGGGGSIVNVTLDAVGGRMMTQTTRENVRKRMAMIMIEKGVPEVLSWPNINSEFGSRFYISGMANPVEARNLALLLRAGALAAPMEFVEERTIGPSLGAENIEKGKNSLLVGFALITIFMIAYYMLFGVISVTALACNLLFLIALLSTMQATLTLPGIAAIALALGMAIDANVLINERIREELRLGMSPQMAIQTGYDRAFDTILDSNITTLIAGLALLIWGSGAVRGFAIVHCLGIVTSIFSAVMVSRGLVNLIYGGRKVSKLSIGNVNWAGPVKAEPAAPAV